MTGNVKHEHKNIQLKHKVNKFLRYLTNRNGRMRPWT